MSKSKGNVVVPSEVLKKYGSEILRLWVAMSDYQSDLKISDNILNQMSELYRKIRNTARFLFANIDGLEELVEPENMGVLDTWILAKAKKVFDEIDESFANYDFSRGLNKLNNFLVADLSGIYLDVCKDRLYCDSANDIHRMASQSAMAMITKALIGTIAPILTYTTDELLDYAPTIIKGDCKDIFDYTKYKLPVVTSTINEQHLIKARTKFSEIVDGLKKEKIIGNTLETIIYTDSEDVLNLGGVEGEDWFIVSGIVKDKQSDVLAKFDLDGKTYEIYKSTQHKCPRCWKYKTESVETVCQRCEDAVKGFETNV